MNDIEIAKKVLTNGEAKKGNVIFQQTTTIALGSDLIYVDFNDVLTSVVECLKEQSDRDNPQPLTLEQLHERVGKPVYIKDMENDDGNWYIVKSLSDEYANRWLRVNDDTGISLGRIKGGITNCYDYEPKEKENG